MAHGAYSMRYRPPLCGMWPSTNNAASPSKKVIRSYLERLRAYPTRRCDAGSFLKDLLPHDRCPHAAGRWRGGDGEWATCPTTGDDLAHSGRAVGVGEGGAAGARISTLRRAPLDTVAASARWRPLRAAHRLPVEGGAGGLRLWLDRASTLPTLGRHGRVGSDVAAAARIL